METRIGFIGILLEDRKESAAQVQKILSNYGNLILGRMGIPGLKEGISVITLIVEATPDDVGALTGQLGRLSGVSVKSGFTK